MISSRRQFALMLAAACIALGLGIRANLLPLPPLLITYTPDVLWAMMVFALATFIAPHHSPPVVALAALGFALIMECSQLYQAEWINDLRATRAGGLLLGHGFLWSDIVCYGVGVGVGVTFISLTGKYSRSIGFTRV